MATFSRSMEIYLNPLQARERIQGSTELEQPAQWAIFLRFEYVFMFPISPSYPEAIDNVLDFTERFLKDFFPRLKPRTTAAISWQVLGGRDPIIKDKNVFPSRITLQAEILGSFQGDREEFERHLNTLRVHVEFVEQRIKDLADEIENNFSDLMEAGVSSPFSVEDRSVIPTQIIRDFREEIELSPEEQILILERRKQRLGLTQQEKSFILEQRQRERAPSEPEPTPEPPRERAPPQPTSFFERVVRFFQNIFRPR